MKRLLIDLQALQGENAQRGIGRYLKGFISQLLGSQSNWQLEFLLNGSSQLNFSSSYEFLKTLTATPKVHVWYPPDRTSENANELAEISLEALYLKIQPDLVLIGSNFEGRSNQIFTHVSTRVKTAVIVYDFIPIKFQEQYLKDPATKDWYTKKLAALQNACLLLCISETTKRDAVEVLNVKLDVAKFIGAGSEQLLLDAKTDLMAETQESLVYVGGLDWRKNIEGLIQAFGISEAQKQGLKLKIVCEAGVKAKSELLRLARLHGLSQDQVEFTGYISDSELAQVYTKAKFCIFPSFYEGFGLPALEAMSFGKAIIVSDTSSLVEIQTNKLAQFNPRLSIEIANAIDKVNFDQTLRGELEIQAKGMLNIHTWQKVVSRFEEIVAQIDSPTTLSSSEVSAQGSRKLKMAYFTPLPPTESGISYYSQQLLPELSKFYDITIIDSTSANRGEPKSKFAIESGSWFEENAGQFDRIVYQVGNSPWHEEAIRYLRSHPGVSVIHDFFLGGFHYWAEANTVQPGLWAETILASHGFGALAKFGDDSSRPTMHSAYPSNLLIQQNSLATLFHSQRAMALNQTWTKFQKGFILDACIPLIPTVDRVETAANQNIIFEGYGIKEDDIVIATFGFLSENKGHLEIAKAFSQVRSGSSSRIILACVGAQTSAAFEATLLSLVSELKLDDVFVTTGWVEDHEYQAWLSRADIVVQLRKSMFGESSAALLDALNYGKSVLTNRGLVEDSQGSFLAVLNHSFTPDDVAQGLQEILTRDLDKSRIAAEALEYVAQYHSARMLAEIYFEQVEVAYKSGSAKMFDFLSETPLSRFDNHEIGAVACSLADSIEPAPRARQIFIDVSTIIFKDEGTGIHRVVNKVAQEFLKRESPGEIVIPVYFDIDSGNYKPADNFAWTKLNIPEASISYGNHIQAWPGDYFLGLDISFRELDAKSQALHRLQARGIRVGTVVHDILPVEHPEFFMDGFSTVFAKWLEFISRFDDVLCVSETTARKYRSWQSKQPRVTSPNVEVFKLGSDFETPVGQISIPSRVPNSFLMVGTLEPRKGHLETLRVFTSLWEGGSPASLTLVGKIGWLNEDLMRTIKSHKEFGKKLIWLENLADEELVTLYRSYSALIAASYGEGLGLPILEAGFHGLPVVARDIEVFREVAGPATIFYNEAAGPNLLRTLEAIIDGELSLEFPASSFQAPTSWASAAESLWSLLHKGTTQ